MCDLVLDSSLRISALQAVPCQHLFCLACLKRHLNLGKSDCPLCRRTFTKSFRDMPRINTALAMWMRAERNKRMGRSATASKPYVPLKIDNRPDKAFRTERAVKTGLANAAGGRKFVNCHPYHIGAIGPEHDPTRERVSC